MKIIPAPILAVMAANEARPVILIEIGTGSPIRIAAHNKNISFAGNTYQAWAAKTGTLTEKSVGQADTTTIKIDNTDKTMEGYHQAETFLNKVLIVRKIFLGASGDSSYYDELFCGWITEVKGSGSWLDVKAIQGSRIEKKYPIREFTPHCPHDFGNDQCNQDGYADLIALTASGTSDSGTNVYLIDNARTESEDFWKYGLIELTRAGVTVYREISSFFAALDRVVWLIPAPFAIENQTTYTIWKGCGKTWDCCNGLNAWGPSSNNLINFGGFRHVARRKLSGE